jgi:hypothetical protein
MALRSLHQLFQTSSARHYTVRLLASQRRRNIITVLISILSASVALKVGTLLVRKLSYLGGPGFYWRPLRLRLSAAVLTPFQLVPSTSTYVMTHTSETGFSNYATKTTEKEAESDAISPHSTCTMKPTHTEITWDSFTLWRRSVLPVRYELDCKYCYK